MNKADVLKKIQEKTGLDQNQCKKINEIIENHFIIGKDNKMKIMKDLEEKLHFDSKKANEIYEMVMQILSSGIKDKLKNPFKGK